MDIGKRLTHPQILSCAFLVVMCSLIYSCSFFGKREPGNLLNRVRTLAGINREFGEPFGIAQKGDEIFISDGENGLIWRIKKDGTTAIFSKGLDTPSQIAFAEDGDLIVADSGDHSIKLVDENGLISVIDGSVGTRVYRDDDVVTGRHSFNAPIGLAVYKNKIYVADTYNDRIRVIEDWHVQNLKGFGRVSTLAGGVRGFEDGASAKFDTPTGLAIWGDGRLLVADSGNKRIRVVEPNGIVWTLAGDGTQKLKDGLLSEATFVQPTAVAVGIAGEIYVADGNAIRVIGRRRFPMVETISNDRRGFGDGNSRRAQFNRPSGLATDKNGNLFVADSANQLVRVLTGEDLGKEVSRKEFDNLGVTAKGFRGLSKPRWTYDPPGRSREIAGTLGEIRGEIKGENSEAGFHNGLDIVGAYGETARFIRDEKALRPIAVQHFDTTRELVRMPTLGYIHIRLGRDITEKPFEDPRFQFLLDGEDNPVGLRIPRGSKFKAGEAIGTLNQFNHVHLIAGRAGREMNVLDALTLPAAFDSRIPTIENVSFYDENWGEIETQGGNSRIEFVGKTRIVVRAFDQMDGNAARRKLGVYKLGYQLFGDDQKAVEGFQNPKWTIKFDKLPAAHTIKLVYAEGSKSGATGETVFRYIVSNEISGKKVNESFFDASQLDEGGYVLRVYAADFFGNIASKDIEFRKPKALS